MTDGLEAARTTFEDGWDARGEYDAQQIAALVKAAQRANMFFASKRRKLGIYARIGDDLADALRALAGQSEEATG